MSRRWQRAVLPAALFLLAALYFRLGYGLTLDWFDEGFLTYQSWRVANGAIPYRDFQQVYGPSVFFLNGALFRLFGADLHVVRVSLVVLKALTAVIVYLCARRVAAWPFALATYGLFVVVWGSPWWVFNAPYPNHYAITLSLSGLLVFLSVRRFRLACALAGVCFGAAATFKQTSGLFAVMAFVLFLVFGSPLSTPVEAPRRESGWLSDWLVRIVGLIVLAGSLTVAVVYLRPGNTLWNTTALLAPLAATSGWLALREVRSRTAAADRVESLIGASYCFVGMLLPLLAYGAWYQHRGLLRELVFNTAYGLLQKLSWFVPFPVFRALLGAGALLTAAAAMRLWRMSAARSKPVRRVAALLALTGFVLALATAMVALGMTELLPGSIRRVLWIADPYSLVCGLPLLLVWVTFVVLVRQGLTQVRSRDPLLTTRQAPLSLFYFFAAASLLLLYPSGDFPHVLMLLPAFLPLFAFCLEWFHRVVPHGSAAVPGSKASAIFLVVVMTVLAAPFVRFLLATMAEPPARVPGFSRATDVLVSAATLGEAADLVRDLDRWPPTKPLFSISGGQMMYFLAARLSPLQREEIVLYFVQAAVIGDDDARELVPEQRIIERLEATNPIVIDREGSPMSTRFRKVYPAVAQYIETRYQLVGTFGNYRVWDRATPSGN